jgi:hypothetical protein
MTDESLNLDQQAALWRYTNGPTMFYHSWDSHYVGLHMDTWYLVKQQFAEQTATIGTVTLGEGPLTFPQGVSAFVTEQAQGVIASFAGLMKPVRFYVGLTPDLTDTWVNLESNQIPTTAEDAQQVAAALDEERWWTEETGEVPFAGIPTFFVIYDLLATVRDGHGAYQDIWLHHAGEIIFRATYWDEAAPTYRAYPYPLTPLAQSGRAQWSAIVRCDVRSLFLPDNTEMLQWVRGSWREWVQTHPQMDVREGQAMHPKPLETLIMTLADPPAATPTDNRDLYERNWPRIQAAVQRWETWLKRPLEWNTR